MENSWLARFLRNPAEEPDPLRHLLVLGWMGRKLDDLVEAAKVQGLGGFQANESILICQKYEYILSCILEDSLWAERDDEVDRGCLWKKYLEVLWYDLTLSLREISRRLNADPMTVKRQAAALRLTFPRLSVRPSRVTPVMRRPPPPRKLADRDHRRATWIKAVRVAKFVKEARKLEPAVFAWLYRNDRPWLKENRPPEAMVVTGSRVDWRAREKSCLAQLPDAYHGIVSKRPFRRCTLLALASEIGAERFLKYLYRMPKLEEELLKLVENNENFALRRLAARAQECRTRQLTFSQLRKLAGVRSSTAEIPRVRAFIDSQASRN